jgi:hypothetical protein
MISEAADLKAPVALSHTQPASAVDGASSPLPGYLSLQHGGWLPL